MEGRCQCGTIRFVTPAAAPSTIYICHCTECRHQSSSTYGITCIFPDFEIPMPHPGAIKTYERPNSTGTTVGHFCTDCGSRLVHKHTDKDGTTGSVVAVKGGCLDGLNRDMMRKAIHLWTSEAIVDFRPRVVSRGSLKGGALRWNRDDGD